MLSDKDDRLQKNKEKITLFESQLKDLDYFTDRAKDFEGKNEVLRYFLISYNKLIAMKLTD